MSLCVSKIINLPPAALKFLVKDEIEDDSSREFNTIGGVFSNTDYAWLSNGPRLEIIHSKTGNKMGAWTFGWILKDFNTEVVCVEELQRPHGRLPLLAVGVDCDFSGGMICIFDFVTSKVIRAIHVKDKITSLHVIDAGFDVFTLPGPLRNFDGIIAVGTAGGDVLLIDICRQICDEALTIGGLNEVRDELNPCQLSYITSKDISKIEYHKELAVRNSYHLAIHLNVILDKASKHFILKGPKGDDRIHVNKEEVTVSALYYCPQLGSLLVGYNFGALQLYNLMNLELVYTSPICDEHIPISYFAIQEPADDPRAYCYVWAVYSSDEQYPTCLPLAVMYAFCYNVKEYHEGYGFLYQNFNTASVHYQMELGVPESHKRTMKPRGGYCLKLNSIHKGPLNREGPHYDSNDDNLTICVLVWNVWYGNKETDTFLTIFDLNQWYKEQMPNVPNSENCSTYMIQMRLSDLINSATNLSIPTLDVYVDKNSLQQFSGAQRLEEHFCPNSLSFGMCCLRKNDIIFLHNYGVQKALLAHIESSGPLCLVEPAEIYQEIIGLGLNPLFIDIPTNTPITRNLQREIILGAALENHLIGWLCKCASEWANGSFLSAGCSLDFLITWAFQRAAAIKSNCDNYCVPLFDYSEIRLDNNTVSLLNNCTRQLKNICSLYSFTIRKLSMFISNRELVDEQFKSLQMVAEYFEVLQWLLNIGLLPECPITAYPRSDDMERINAPYPAQMLTNFYDYRRTILKLLNQENFSTSASVLFIDVLIERECGGKLLQEQWQNDGGNGLYPPPSLQALLRTYLIDNVDLSFKHSVVIYVFLDLAMTLDQERYKPVITHLIKFPAVFKVSPSLIKITQAFWQLDHGDYNTAMGLLLDPLISIQDLRPWHHKVVLRSLLLQKQPNFALLYFQVRKPAFQDDEDIFTALSLYVSNNMLDEAFYFEKHFTNLPNGEKFLTHLFDECKKNDKLKSIIYRSLSSTDENFFLKYLLNNKQSVAEDLYVYYHILRSHYIEVFENYDHGIPNQIENQGLCGQESAIPRDKLIYNLKKLLPDVTKEILSLCHKEKNNIWQQDSGPTPMSVFVCNPNENAQYKANLIGAALAKAKQTFTDTINNKEFKLKTEETPFLCNPKAFKDTKRSSVVIVNPKIIDDDYLSPPAAKRLKLSPRAANATVSSISTPSRLDTPVIKRKMPKIYATPEKRDEVRTPHSILKVKSLIDQTPSKEDAEFKDDIKAFEKLEYTPVTSNDKKSGLNLSARRSIAKPSPVVRFEGVQTTSPNGPNLSGIPDKSTELSSFQHISGSSKSVSGEDELFYSPDTSFEEEKDLERNETVEETKQSAETIDKIENETRKLEVTEENETRKLDVTEDKQPSPVFSPKARRSYKRSLGSLTPVRSSPRLSNSATALKELSTPSSSRKLLTTVRSSPRLSDSATALEDLSTPSSSRKLLTPIRSSPRLSYSATALKEMSTPSSSRKLSEESSVNEISAENSKEEKSDNTLDTFQLESTSPISKMEKDSFRRESDSSPNEVSSFLPKLRPRRSLCRKVLETNTFHKALNSSMDSPMSRKSQQFEDSLRKQKETRIEESTEKIILESTLKYVDGEESHRSTFIKKHNLMEQSFTDSDLDTSLDFSIDYDIAEEPRLLSESMIRYINDDNTVSVLNNNSVIEENAQKEDSENEKSQNTTALNEKIENSFEEKDLSDKASKDENLVDEQQNKVIDDEVLKNKSDTSNLDSSQNKAIDSKLENTVEVVPVEPTVESVIDDISEKNDQIQEVNTDKNQWESMMDVSVEVDEDSKKIQEGRKADMAEEEEENLAIDNTSQDHREKMQEFSEIESSKELSDVEINQEEQDDEQENVEEHNEEFFENKFSAHPTDKEINDLDVTNNLVVDKEITLGNEDEQNSSKEENDLEKAILDDSWNSEESSQEDQDDSYNEEDTEEQKSEHELNVDNSQNEIIEIGSSSDEQDQNQEESNESNEDDSQSGDNEEENLNVSYERNIYDPEDFSSESEYEANYTEVSYDSDDIKDETHAHGLFYGTMVVSDDNEKSDEGEKPEEFEEKSPEEEEESIITTKNSEDIPASSEIKGSEQDKDSEESISNEETSIITTKDSEDIPASSEIKGSEQDKDSEESISNEETSIITTKDSEDIPVSSEIKGSEQDKDSEERVSNEEESIIITRNSEDIPSSFDIKDNEQDKDSEESGQIRDIVVQTVTSSEDMEDGLAEEENKSKAESKQMQSGDQISCQTHTKEEEVGVKENAEVNEDEIEEKVKSEEIVSATMYISEENVDEQKDTNECESFDATDENVKCKDIMLEKVNDRKGEAEEKKEADEEGSVTKDEEIVDNNHSEELAKEKETQKAEVSDAKLEKIDNQTEGLVKEKETLKKKVSDAQLEKIDENNKNKSAEKVESSEEQKLDTEIVKNDDFNSRCPLDKTIRMTPKVVLDIIDSIDLNPAQSFSTIQSSVASCSVSVNVSKSQEKNIVVKKPSLKRSARSNSEPKDTLNEFEPKTTKRRESDIIDKYSTTPTLVRVLRSRTISTEERDTPSPVVSKSLRKRSASVDIPSESQTSNENQPKVKEDRQQRAASVSRLPQITEEDEAAKMVTPKKSRSVLENYSESRRMTRRQMRLLQNSVMKSNDGKKIDIDHWDPTVLLDKPSFEGQPDPDEKKVYETSPSNSSTTSSVKRSSRLRSASQISDRSPRSRSRTPVMVGSVRRTSADETMKSNKTTPRRKKTEEDTEDIPLEPRITRSRLKSTSSNISENSSASETSHVSKRKQKTTLPNIKEESDESEKSNAPKKRIRKHSPRK